MRASSKGSAVPVFLKSTSVAKEAKAMQDHFSPQIINICQRTENGRYTLISLCKHKKPQIADFLYTLLHKTQLQIIDFYLK